MTTRDILCVRNRTHTVEDHALALTSEQARAPSTLKTGVAAVARPRIVRTLASAATPRLRVEDALVDIHEIDDEVKVRVSRNGAWGTAFAVAEP